MSGAKNLLNDFAGGNTMGERAFSENKIKYNTRAACVRASSDQTRLQTESLYESGNRDDDNGGVYNECVVKCARNNVITIAIIIIIVIVIVIKALPLPSQRMFLTVARR